MRSIFNLKNFLKKNSKGFTLTELLVVTAIMAILTSTILLNYRNTGQQFALQRSAHKAAQDIRRAGEMAMAAKEYGSPPIIPSRYGIEFEKGRNYYILFADRNDNGTYEPPDEIIYGKITFEEGISIKNLYSSSGGPFFPKNKLSVTFKPPAPIITIRDPGEGPYLGRIELTNAQNQTKTININAAGLIDID